MFPQPVLPPLVRRLTPKSLSLPSMSCLRQLQLKLKMLSVKERVTWNTRSPLSLFLCQSASSERVRDSPVGLLVTGLGTSQYDLGSPGLNSFHQELDEFAGQLKETGAFPDPEVENVVQQHSNELNPPEDQDTAEFNSGVKSLFDVGRSVGIEVARANNVLLQEFFAKQS